MSNIHFIKSLNIGNTQVAILQLTSFMFFIQNVSGIYALSVNTLQFNRQLDELFQRTQILTKEPRLDSWLAKVLITELLWGKQHLPGSSKPIQTILAYADKLQEESKSLGNTERSSVPKIGNTWPLYRPIIFV